MTKFLVIMSLDLLAGSYPLAKVRDNYVFFLQLNAFEALKMVKDVSAASTVSLKAKNARISAPIGAIRAAFDEVPFFKQDIFCTNLFFEDKARLVYLASCFEGEDKQDLYIAFKQHWLANRPINRKGIEVIFLKDGVENMRMSV